MLTCFRQYLDMLLFTNSHDIVSESLTNFVKSSSPEINTESWKFLQLAACSWPRFPLKTSHDRKVICGLSKQVTCYLDPDITRLNPGDSPYGWTAVVVGARVHCVDVDVTAIRLVTTRWYFFSSRKGYILHTNGEGQLSQTIQSYGVEHDSRWQPDGGERRSRIDRHRSCH